MALLTSQEIQAAFQRPMPKIRITAGYRAQLLLVLIGLVILQLLYLALIAGVMWLTALVTAAIWTSDIRASGLNGIIFVAPPAIGLIAVIFLLKPLVIRPPKPPQPL